MNSRADRISTITASHQKLRDELEAKLANPDDVKKLTELLDLERDLTLMEEQP